MPLGQVVRQFLGFSVGGPSPKEVLFAPALSSFRHRHTPLSLRDQIPIDGCSAVYPEILSASSDQCG